MSMSEKELSAIVWVGGFLLSLIGGLIAVCGSIFMLLLQRHREYNNSEHDEFKMIDQKLFDRLEEVNEKLHTLQGEHNIRCKK